MSTSCFGKQTARAPDLESVEKLGVLHINAPDTETPKGWLDVDALFAAETDDTEPLVETGDDDMCSLMYTSGTEAQPKGVMNTHKSFFNTLLSGAADLNIRKDDAALLSIPLYHIAGKYLLLEFINLGCKLVLEYAPNPIEILELTQNEKVTYWVYPPTLYQILPSMPGFDTYDLSSLKQVSLRGAAGAVAISERPLLNKALGWIYDHCFCAWSCPRNKICESGHGLRGHLRYAIIYS
jgi:fatty-acyl-CoA synthase